MDKHIKAVFGELTIPHVGKKPMGVWIDVRCKNEHLIYENMLIYIFPFLNALNPHIFCGKFGKLKAINPVVSM